MRDCCQTSSCCGYNACNPCCCYPDKSRLRCVLKSLCVRNWCEARFKKCIKDPCGDMSICVEVSSQTLTSGEIEFTYKVINQSTRCMQGPVIFDSCLFGCFQKHVCIFPCSSEEFTRTYIPNGQTIREEKVSVMYRYSCDKYCSKWLYSPIICSKVEVTPVPPTPTGQQPAMLMAAEQSVDPTSGTLDVIVSAPTGATYPFPGGVMTISFPGGLSNIVSVSGGAAVMGSQAVALLGNLAAPVSFEFSYDIPPSGMQQTFTFNGTVDNNSTPTPTAASTTLVVPPIAPVI